ncbi:MAG: hypothetical protein GC190_20980 [Alphaproteobacteria bacterium]|nr:hypothetical protein [Alphaproteobacteria bacterium]
MNKDFMLSLVRHASTFVGGLLIARGFADASQVETLVSGLVTATGIFWALWHHTPDAPPNPNA